MFAGFNWQQMISAFIVLFAVIDIIGSIPIIINLKEKGKDVNAMKATVISFALLIGFFYAGDMMTLGCLSFAGCCVALTALFLLKSSWLTEAFSAVLNALCLFIPFEEFVNSSFSIPTLVYYLTVAAVFLFSPRRGWKSAAGTERRP